MSEQPRSGWAEPRLEYNRGRVTILRGEFAIARRVAPPSRGPYLTDDDYAIVDDALRLLSFLDQDARPLPHDDAERDIHGLCPGHPIAAHPAATCTHCNMSRSTLERLAMLESTGRVEWAEQVAADALSTPEQPLQERGPERRKERRRTLPIRNMNTPERRSAGVCGRRTGKDRRQPVSTQREDAVRGSLLDQYDHALFDWLREQEDCEMTCHEPDPEIKNAYDLARIALLRALPTEPVQQGGRPIEGFAHSPMTVGRMGLTVFTLAREWDDQSPATLIIHTPPVSEPTKEEA